MIIRFPSSTGLHGLVALALVSDPVFEFFSLRIFLVTNKNVVQSKRNNIFNNVKCATCFDYK